MKINGLTVSVGYSDLLSIGIGRWASSLDSLTVVTDHQDDDSVRLAESWGARVHRTNVFYERGAMFNKAGAMEEARRSMPWLDWILFFDSDIVPQRDWLEVAESCNPKSGRIHGAKRMECLDVAEVDSPTLKPIETDGACVGYFQLFHSNDKRAQTGNSPLLEGFTNASVYDCLFKDRWPAQDRVMLPLRLVHLGERDNWCGRGRRDLFNAMMAERSKRGGWEHERIA